MEIYQSQNITELAKVMLKVQTELRPVLKDAKNPFTGSHYATLHSVMEACRDVLISNGIWLCQYPVPVESGHMGLTTRLTHAESGQWQASLAVVPLPKADPQGYGSCLTYARRYALTAMLGMVAGDDDGEGAKITPQKQKRKNAVKQAPPDSMPEPSPQSREYPDMPRIDGIRYQTVVTQDGRECIVASGNTQAKKSLLLGTGFRWSEQRKMWWKYSDAS
jgi:hypothetical protein